MILSNILTMYKIKLNQLLIYLFFSIFFVSNLYTKPIKFEGLKKLKKVILLKSPYKKKPLAKSA